jgi:hypothetical protein
MLYQDMKYTGVSKTGFKFYHKEKNWASLLESRGLEINM